MWRERREARPRKKRYWNSFRFLFSVVVPFVPNEEMMFVGMEMDEYFVGSSFCFKILTVVHTAQMICKR